MPCPAHRSDFPRVLAPLSGSLWIAFLLLSVAVTVLWFFDIGEFQIKEMVKAREPQAALLWLAGVIDIVWLALAALTVYSSLAQAVGLATARRSTALVLVASWLLGAISVWSGWPLGKIHFTERLGFLVGPVSIGWLLLWCVCVFGARDILLTALPRASHRQTALLTGILVLLAEINLEPLAWKIRVWWLWMEKTSPPAFGPLQSHLAWLVVSAALAWCLRMPILNRPGASGISRAAKVFVIFQVMLLLTHLGGFLRG